MVGARSSSSGGSGKIKGPGTTRAKRRAAKMFKESQAAAAVRAVSPAQVSEMTSTLMTAHANCLRGAARLRAAGKHGEAAQMMARAKELHSRRRAYVGQFFASTFRRAGNEVEICCLWALGYFL